MDKNFWSAVQGRRSIYTIDDTPIVSEARITQITADALRHVPSPYNSQTTRLLLLFGEAHKTLWQLTLDALRPLTKPERFAETEDKINSCFAAGYGTVLYFVDKDAVGALVAQFPLYAEKFTLWAQHSNAMHQFVIWSALEAEGLGASLQHYNPVIDDAVKKRWNVPQSWELIAQMPFGRPTAAPGEKEISPIPPRLLVRHDTGEA